MNAQDKAKLRRDMGEAATLPPEDPERRVVEAKIAEIGPWAEKEWLGILAENEHLRLELMRVDPPAGLVERLLKIPDCLAQPRSVSRFRWWLMAAAAVILLALVGLPLLYISQTQSSDFRVATIATFAIEHHMRDQSLTVETSNIDLLPGRLAKQVPFPVVLPKMGPDFSLIGGRKCKLCRRPVVYSLWSTPQGKSALFQFRAIDFKLPPNMSKKIRCFKGLVKPGSPCDAVVWTVDGRGYALITYHDTNISLIAAASRLPFKIDDGA